MFDNIGAKLRSLGKLLLIVGIVFSGIAMIGMWITGGGLAERGGGFTVFLTGLMIGAVGCLMSLVMACLVYGFGQLVEDTQAIRHNTEDTQYSAEELRRIISAANRAHKAEQSE